MDRPNGWMDQYATWYGTEVGLGPGHTVLDGDPPPNGHSPLQFFGPCLLRPTGWMDQDAIWYGGRPRPRPHCVRWRPSLSAQGAQQPPFFRPMPIVAKRSPISIPEDGCCYGKRATSHSRPTESPYTLQWATLSPKIAPYHGGSGPLSNS